MARINRTELISQNISRMENSLNDLACLLYLAFILPCFSMGYIFLLKINNFIIS